MLFLVTYKGDIEAVFFHIWDAQQYLNFFDKEEQEQMEINRVNEYEDDILINLKKTLQNVKKTVHTDHCCGNCGRTHWEHGIFICDFNHEEINPNDICTHYI